MSIRHGVFALSLAGVVGLGGTGCSLLMRAAKGELTPIGADGVGYDGVATLGRTLAETDEQAAFASAYRELSSIYLYKCMDKPTKVPERGDPAVRAQAGKTLVAALQRRTATRAHVADLALDAEVAALDAELGKKCGGGLGKQDPDGLWAKASAIATTEGRAKYIESTVQGLSPRLDDAIAKDGHAVRRWVEGECGRELPAWEYCAPFAGQKLVASQRYDVLFVALLDGTPQQGEALLGELATRVGKDKLADEVREYLLGGKSPLPSAPRALDLTASFLDQAGRWGKCEEHAATWRRTLAAGESVTGQWVLDRIAAEGCRNVDDAIVKALGSDDAGIRERAVWAVGELKLQKAKKHLERMQWSDPFMSQGCWCYPVRDAAKQAVNKLELAG